MDYKKHLELLKGKLDNPIKGLPLNIEGFKSIVPFIEKEQRILLISDSGIGKAQTNDSIIYTPEGFKTMGEVIPGDFVITKNGKPTKVLQIFPKKDLNIYKITFSDGTQVDCCEDHLWEVKSRGANTYYVKSTKDLLKLKLIGKSGVKNKRHEWTVDLCEEVEHTKKELPIDPYTLGYLLGNGCFGKTTSMVTHINDFQEIVSYLKMPQSCKINIQKFQPSLPNNGRLYITNNIKPLLQSLGLNGKKSHDKFIPDKYFYSSVEDRYALLAGLLDSDAYIENLGHKCKISYSTVSPLLAKNVQQLVRSLGGTCVISEDRRDKYTYGVCYNLKIRTRKNPFRLKRKANVFDSVGGFTQKFRKGISNIEYVGVKDGKCILVEDSSHLYLTNDYTVTHNTSWTLKYLIYDLVASNMDVNIYYFSIELSSVVIYCKIYQYLLARKGVLDYRGEDYTLNELQSPSNQKTIDDIASLEPSLKVLFSKLLIIDSIHAPEEMYKFMKKETKKYGKEIIKADGQVEFEYFDENKHVIVITDTINALQPDPGKTEYESIKRWSENYCKLYLSKIYKFIILNVQQTDNSVKASSYTNTGSRIEDKHTPTLGSLATVKSTPADHTLVFSLFSPHRYSLKTCDGYSINRFKDKFIKVNIMKNNFGQMGPDINAYLYYEGVKGNYQDIPNSADKALLEDFMKAKGLPELTTIAPKNIL